MQAQPYAALEDLAPDHSAALVWFANNSGRIVPWSELNKRKPHLAIAPKGIHRPTGWPYSLSIRIIPSGTYPDEEPREHGGTVSFRYHQETPKGQDPAKARSNLGLAACMRDGVPVGVVRRVAPKPDTRYEVLGLGRVSNWSDGFFTVEFLSPGQVAQSAPKEAGAASAVETAPVSMDDARTKIAQSIVRRRGQAKFRAELLEAYGGRCAVTGCPVAAVLEAAHIKPYLGDHTNVVQNGLLLRADLHTLFDLKLLRIEPQSRTIVLGPALEGTEYWPLNGRPLAPTKGAADRPAQDCLDYAWAAGSVL